MSDEAEEEEKKNEDRERANEEVSFEARATKAHSQQQREQRKKRGAWGSAYFKSTDGHTGEWSFSLRRLNLQLFEVIGAYGG